MARRERYRDLVNQCQMMHSSIGTGNLAFVVGSKVMDVRTLSKDNSDKKLEATSENNSGTSTELVSTRMSTDSAAYNYCSRSSECEINELQYDSESFNNFPSLPVTNLFLKDYADENEGAEHETSGDRTSISERTRRLNDEYMYNFQTNNNVDLTMELDVPPTSNIRSDIFHSDIPKCKGAKEMVYGEDVVNSLKILDIPEAPMTDKTLPNGLVSSEDRVSEWLWTLHRIVVDVVRTDNHLEFYGDTKNIARMSDILAVYAWVDPATGYCQGMSDLLSPFIVLNEDNADAFWCFEMLLRRMRENFQMEGPTGVMNQLQTLWKVLELVDAEMFGHLSLIGAESLHFAFRMLLVLFRRELSFDEALHMWEMMWAADFDEALCEKLEKACLEPLVLQLRNNLGGDNFSGNSKRKLKKIHSKCKCGESLGQNSNGAKSISLHPFCGLPSTNCWAKTDQLQPCSLSVSTRNSDDGLQVFCVAAILIINHQKIMRETHSIDDVIKMFNDNILKIHVKRCIRLAVKLRKKYYYKLIKQTSSQHSE